MGLNKTLPSIFHSGTNEINYVYKNVSSLSLLGGGKKRKKKQYTGPKKQKHVRKKVKLGVLKLYKVREEDRFGDYDFMQ